MAMKRRTPNDPAQADTDAGPTDIDTDADLPPVDANEWAQTNADATADRRYFELVAQCELYRRLQDSMEEIVADTKAAASSVKADIDRLVGELNAPKRMKGRGFAMTRSVSTTKKINPVKLADYGVSVAVIKAATEIKKKEIVTIRKVGASDGEEGQGE